jgi:hypothetical protein
MTNMANTFWFFTNFTTLRHILHNKPITLSRNSRDRFITPIKVVFWIRFLFWSIILINVSNVLKFRERSIIFKNILSVEIENTAYELHEDGKIFSSGETIILLSKMWYKLYWSAFSNPDPFHISLRVRQYFLYPNIEIFVAKHFSFSYVIFAWNNSLSYNISNNLFR